MKQRKKDRRTSEVLNSCSRIFIQGWGVMRSPNRFQGWALHHALDRGCLCIPPCCPLGSGPPSPAQVQSPYLDSSSVLLSRSWPSSDLHCSRTKRKKEERKRSAFFEEGGFLNSWAPALEAPPYFSPLLGPIRNKIIRLYSKSGKSKS